jgi:hypothetical protein
MATNRVNSSFYLNDIKFIAFFDVVNILNRKIANSENFNYFRGKTYYDGLAIFPTGGFLKGGFYASAQTR